MGERVRVRESGRKRARGGGGGSKKEGERGGERGRGRREIMGDNEEKREVEGATKRKDV